MAKKIPQIVRICSNFQNKPHKAVTYPYMNMGNVHRMFIYNIYHIYTYT